jgi:DNA-directed RNA polymerase subunit N (RpoN/RPB10)
MDDIKCLICGEPYDNYYVNHDMTVSERNRLLSGKGCECCKGVKPEGRTESDRFADIGHNILTSEDPDAILNKLGL